MNILFLTLLGFDSLKERGIYTDLLREFVKNDHIVYVISPIERREGKKTYLSVEKNARILRLRIGNTQKTNIIEKGISTVMIAPMFKSALEKHFPDVRFDLILYSTPPITIAGVVEYVKKKDGAKTYLLLKDIFPQNAVDIGMMSTSGFKGLLYHYFRKQEKRLYNISDRIGCMSPANAKYVIDHNSEIAPEKVEVCPNSIEVFDKSIDKTTRNAVRQKYNIPLDKKVFVYGGNLGKPQGVPFLIECLKKCASFDNDYFIVVGDGTEYSLLKKYVDESKQKNLTLMHRMPKEDFDILVAACDVGMIFLDNRFTIPNFPSRLLSYMQAKLPVLAVTDSNTDIGSVITGVDHHGNTINESFGWWCKSDDAKMFANLISRIENNELQEYGRNSYEYLKKYYSVEEGYRIISKIFYLR